MVTTTQSVNDKVTEIFKNEENENNESITRLSRFSTRKVNNSPQLLYEKIDSLFDETDKTEYSGDSPYILHNETNGEGIQTEIESHEDPHNKTHVTNEERIKLLARKYIKKLSNEETARLEILCERVRQFFPRATSDDFVQLERIGTELKDLEEENKKIKEKYNLD